jgi:uncharacterized OsmC-like protein
MGTTGTIMGCSRYLKSQNPDGHHRGVPAHATGRRSRAFAAGPKEYLPKIYEPARVDRMIDISPARTPRTPCAASRCEAGVFVGVSAGGATWAALKVAPELESGVVVCILCDRGDRYLSSGVFGASRMSAAKSMSISLRPLRGALFEARNASGQTTLIDGPPDLGGQGEGVRPMEAVLMALAGCSALDVIHILEKQQKEPLGDLDVDVRGPARRRGPRGVHRHRGATSPPRARSTRTKLERAVKLSMEKYCSVSKMLAPTVNITWSVTLKG